MTDDEPTDEPTWPAPAARPWGAPSSRHAPPAQPVQPGAPLPTPDPWTAPPAQTWAPPGGHPGRYGVQPVWRSVHGLGVALQILLWCSLGAWLLKLLATANQRSIGEDAFAGDFTALRDIEDADSLVAGTGALAVMLMIAVFVLIVIWLWRAAKNLEVLGRANPTLGPGWAIGGWFIPAANFVLPALVINDAWRGSDPQVPIGRTDWKRAPGSGLFVLWWIAFVAAGLLGIVSGGFSNESGEYESIADFRNGTSFGIAQATLYCLAAVLGALFVRALTRRQDTWGHHLGGQSAGFAAAPPMPPPAPGGPVSPSQGPI